LKEIIASWQPDMLLPKTYRDRRKTPVPIDGLSQGLL